MEIQIPEVYQNIDELQEKLEVYDTATKECIEDLQDDAAGNIEESKEDPQLSKVKSVETPVENVHNEIINVEKHDIRSKYLIETEELQQMIRSNAKVKIINATWYLPNNPVNAWEEHLSNRITKDTVFFDHNEICDKNAPFPHTMPSLETFI